MGVEIRRYRPEDEAFLFRLFEASNREAKRRNQDLSIPPGFARRYLPKTIRSALGRNGFLRVAEVDGQPAGFILALIGKTAPWDQSRTRSCFVMELHVATRFRKQGVGRFLVESAEAHYRERGYDWISLGVFADNSGARQFYDRMGFGESYLFLGKKLRK